MAAGDSLPAFTCPSFCQAFTKTNQLTCCTVAIHPLKTINWFTKVSTVYSHWQWFSSSARRHMSTPPSQAQIGSPSPCWAECAEGKGREEKVLFDGASCLLQSLHQKKSLCQNHDSPPPPKRHVPRGTRRFESGIVFLGSKSRVFPSIFNLRIF